MQAPAVKTDQAGPPIEDLKLGQLIVKTRKGRLFRGSYQRQPAAIKVTHVLPMWGSHYTFIDAFIHFILRS